MAEDPQILLVDDEETIRLTLPLLLESHGFKVTAVGTVAEALRLMAERRFDLLIADMNIERPGDGFTLVSAMRSTQPTALRFILTGYPDVESALQALRQQVDDYLIKPTDADALVSLIREKLHTKTRREEIKTKPLREMIQREREYIVQRWLELTKKDADLNMVRLPDQDRMDHLPRLLDIAVRILRGKELSAEDRQASALHGETRFRQGYSPKGLVREARLLQNAIAACVQQNLLEIEISTLIPDLLRVFDLVQGLLEESLTAFLQQQRAPRRTRANS